MEAELPTKKDDFDLERNEAHQFLMNNTVQSFAWSDLRVTVKDRRTKLPRQLIDGISGSVQQGRFLYCLVLAEEGQLMHCEQESWSH